MRARRVAAGALVVLAGVATVRSDPEPDRVDVLVAVRDLKSGAALTADDVRLENRSATTVPDGSQGKLETALGATLAGPVRRGEVLTDVRLLGSRLAESTAGPGARIVPLHLTDAALIDLLRVGDVVDVLAGDPAATPRILVTDATVVLISASQKSQASERVVLVALPGRLAAAVAGAALGQAVTLVLH